MEEIGRIQILKYAVNYAVRSKGEIYLVNDGTKIKLAVLEYNRYAAMIVNGGHWPDFFDKSIVVKIGHPKKIVKTKSDLVDIIFINNVVAEINGEEVAYKLTDEVDLSFTERFKDTPSLDYPIKGLLAVRAIDTFPILVSYDAGSNRFTFERAWYVRGNDKRFRMSIDLYPNNDKTVFMDSPFAMSSLNTGILNEVLNTISELHKEYPFDDIEISFYNLLLKLEFVGCEFYIVGREEV